MKVLSFNDEVSALARNHEEAISRGCNGVTLYWWPLQEINNKWCLIVNDDEVHENEIKEEI